MAHNQQVWDLIDFEDWLDADMEAAGYEIERHGARRPRYIVPDRMDPFVAMTKEEFVDRFRLPKHSVVELIGEIQEQLPAANDRRGCPVPPSLQVLIAIRCMAAGGHQISVGDCFDVSQAKVSECLKAVSRAIASLCRQYIRFPVGNGIRRKMLEFQGIARMPGVIGAIDCTHIPIIMPSVDNSEVYRCRKGYFSLNVQAVSGPDLMFYDVVARWPGSVHDSRIFSNSRICAELEEGLFLGHLLGDSGYPCRNYILTPLGNPRDRHEEAYNLSHSRTRNTVERAFGVLKKRFAYLGGKVRTHLRTTQAIIVAAMVLHNKAVLTRVVMDEGQEIDVDNDAVLPAHINETVQGRVKRQQIIRHYF